MGLTPTRDPRTRGVHRPSRALLRSLDLSASRLGLAVGSRSSIGGGGGGEVPVG